eukprot:1930615-Rhodomonas_salina.2
MSVEWMLSVMLSLVRFLTLPYSRCPSQYAIQGSEDNKMCTRENRLNLNLSAEEIKALTDEIIVKMTKVELSISQSLHPASLLRSED